MEVRVEHLLRMERLRHAVVVAGTAGLANVVKGITIMEAPDIADWLRGGEMLLTSLYAIRSFTDDENRNFVLRLGEKKVSAILIKHQRFVTSIPHTIIETGERISLPVIQIPEDVPYVDVLYPVMQKLFNTQVVKLSYYRTVHDRFTALSLNDAGLEAIASTLEELIGNPVAVYDRHRTCISASSGYTEPVGEKVRNEAREKAVDTKFPYYWVKIQSASAAGRTEELEQVVVPIHTVNHIKAYLVVSEVNKPLEELDFIAIESAATALSLELVKQFAVSEVVRKFENDIIDDLLAGKVQNAELIYQRAEMIGWDLKRAYAVMLFQINEEKLFSSDRELPKPGDSHRYLSKTSTYLQDAIRDRFPEGIMRSRSDTIIVLLPADDCERKARGWLSPVKEKARDIRKCVKRKAPHSVVQVGIGNIAESALEIADSYVQAQHALELGGTLHGCESVTAYSELGLYRILCQFPDPAALAAFIPPSLNKLAESKNAMKHELLRTLEVFLQHNQNATKASLELFVHYKTVMYRLERIKEMTGMDFDDPEEMFAVRVGLKILYLLDKTGKIR
ncbi:PucR family transcriptional regulator [Brevibacillus sp. B_LB10_24]|uniref:PucR family transcriptional regulator n=1 Tax=Brevibacillus sp. B_LB10_24 TaxID=3380645 RepID=UPI0038BB7CD9